MDSFRLLLGFHFISTASLPAYSLRGKETHVIACECLHKVCSPYTTEVGVSYLASPEKIVVLEQIQIAGSSKFQIKITNLQAKLFQHGIRSKRMKSKIGNRMLTCLRLERRKYKVLPNQNIVVPEFKGKIGTHPLEQMEKRTKLIKRVIGVQDYIEKTSRSING